MRIGVVSNAYHPDIGGVETHVRRLCAGLTAAGDDVEVITQHAARSVENIDGVLVRRFPLTVPAGNYRFSLPLLRWLRTHAETYDVLHAHSYHALAALCAALGNSRTPLVFTPHYHGTGHTRFRAALHRLYRPLGRTILNRSSAIVCVTAAERELLIRHFPEVADRTVVIPNGTDPRPAASAVPGQVRRILCVGRLEQYKRVDRVIRAMAHLGPEHRLDVVGTGPAGAQWRQLAARLGLAGQVVFHGRLDDATFASCLAQASAAVSASAHEAFGMSVADALAAGLPTVAAPIPAHQEVARLAGDGVWLRYADPDDEADLAAAMIEATSTGRKRPATLPTWDHVVRGIRDVYTAVASKPVAAAGAVGG
ncbi:glycosyltransferase involved in cell wall biosynthesis [Actinoplanes lutulentus]|uniref:Glycosyltransferase involved in cell wall biosynthesis n=1 Tax=Actinoplanes lutulentus TaxID=1287878 RepID=A0A327ZCM5_9ACTN|nr:glycosyltransferase family 4 protein [Actinoplanes lutulentus]MBB2942565.1 glycosyltransferase involved in cell wall biosynthesis [Actinoplanes lutulentus]RAK38146.1 glycosyltransferase involved in cell wall biosynthesis [Actinoplanes lutulentus]